MKDTSISRILEKLATVRFERDSNILLYKQLKHHIIHLISSGYILPGSQLPSIRQMAFTMALSPGTVFRACDELRNEGLLVGKSRRGFSVSEFSRSPSLLNRAQLLNGIISQAVEQARAFGFEMSEIIDAIQHQGGLEFNDRKRGNLVLITRNEPGSRRYADILKRELGDLVIGIEGTSLPELEKNAESVLNRLEPVIALAGSVSALPLVNEIAARRRVPVFPIVLELTKNTLHSLSDLSKVGPVGFIAEQYWLPSLHALLAMYVESKNIYAAHGEDLTAIREILARGFIIVHTIGVRDLVNSMTDETVRLVELEMEPSPNSIQNLRAGLAQMGLIRRG